MGTHRDRDRVAVGGTAVTATVTIWGGSRLAGESGLEVDSVGVRANILPGGMGPRRPRHRDGQDRAGERPNRAAQSYRAARGRDGR